jgi:hypothetical protein
LIRFVIAVSSSFDPSTRHSVGDHNARRCVGVRDLSSSVSSSNSPFLSKRALFCRHTRGVVVLRERRGFVVPAFLEFLSVSREAQRDGVHDDCVGAVQVTELERELASATPDVQDGRARPDALKPERVY